MNKETMLLNAAKAMGAKDPKLCQVAEIWGISEYIYDDIVFIGGWNPLESSADCAEMEDALSIDTLWTVDGVSAMKCDDDTAESVGHYALFKDHPSKGSARRYASTMVTAMIGAKL